MSEPSAKSFLKLLERSGIVAEDRLKSSLAKLSTKADGKTINLKDLAGHLMESGLITQWHIDKLLAGKYKGFFLGKYKLLGHLGSGGMSSVYLAQHKISEQFRAIKVLPRKKVADKSYLDRFYLEARVAASLNHPNVIRIYDICNEGDTHYMVMEYVDGTDLYELGKKNGPFDFNSAAKFTAQAAEGLIHAHQQDLVHRDIKPANLFKTDQGLIKILDLGLALVNQNDSQSLTVLHNEKVMGTADYLSPEQAVNSHDVDSRADIYSLGCTLYYFLTGHPPFPKGSLAQRIAMHQSLAPKSIYESRPECPESLVKICEKMMAKDPDDRYQTCDEVKSELMALVESGELENIATFAPEDSLIEKTSSTTVSATDHDTTLAAIKSVEPVDESNIGHAIEESANASSHVNKASESQKSNRITPPPPRKRRRPPPKWVVPAAIAAMFLILIAVLTLVSFLL
ncbi:serine/threonine protein kinase [bacterium]|nr:serine/threonine protein kinase [bacterium]MDA7922959.1 serine/threonine protein kinase [bacterium]MDB4396386.1 serine/threonine protein kinase [bacterium]